MEALQGIDFSTQISIRANEGRIHTIYVEVEVMSVQTLAQLAGGCDCGGVRGEAECIMMALE